MKQRLFRAVSLVLALALLVCLIPAVYAEDLDSSQESGPTEETTGLGRELDVGDALVPLSSLYSNARSGGTITVTAEPSWYCGDFQYGVYDALSGYPDTMVFNKGNYWVNDFSYFVLSNGQIGYCVQPYKPGTTGDYTQNPGAWSDLSRYRTNGVGLAFLYGAPNNGNTTQADYIATAAVVRDMACGYRMADTSFTTNGDTGAAFTSSPFGEKLRASYPEAYTKYQEILAAIAKHGTIPSFTSRYKSAIGEAQTVKLKLNKSTGLYEASVTDTNGVLAYFNYSSSLAGVTFTRSGNTLNITATKEAAKSLTGGVTISGRGFEFSDPQDVCTVWTADPSTTNGGSTQLIAVMDAATDPVPSYFNIVAENVEADINVVKTSNDGKVDGISFTVKNNTTGVTTTQTTANGGRFSFKATVGDSVTITEHVPEGYVNTAASQTITVVGGTNTVTFSNVLRQGQITVNKTAETFSSVTQADGVYQPVYAEAPLAGAVFEIRAAEEIKAPDGSTVLATGELADTITTGADGKATSKLLYLGRYTVTEITAPTGTALYPMSKDVILEYTGTEGAVVPGSAAFVNQRQRAVLSLVKILEADPEFGITQGAEITSVKFGLYAAEAMTAADGSTIPADGLLEAAACDAEGKITFQTDLPYGARVYIQEIATAEGYVLNDTKYPVDFPELNQDVVKVDVAVNDGAAIENDLIRGTILGKKIDEDGFTICGATFGLFRQYETEFTEETAILTSVSNEIGVFGFEDVPYGSYIVREIKPAPGFVLNEDLYGVEVTENEVVLEGTIENKFLTGSVQVTKLDAENTDTKLSGAVFEVYADVDSNQAFDGDIDILVGELAEVKTGVYRMDNLRYNGYFVHEKAAPEGYLQDNGYYYFAIREDGEVVEVGNEAGVGFTNVPGKGELVLTKTDASDGKLLPDAGYRVYDQDGEVAAEGYTDENGVVKFTLRIGRYTYQEFDAPEGYLLDSAKYAFEIQEDGQIIKAAATNTAVPETPKTGDTSGTRLAACITALIVSGTAAAYLAVYRRRKRSR